MSSGPNCTSCGNRTHGPRSRTRWTPFETVPRCIPPWGQSVSYTLPHVKACLFFSLSPSSQIRAGEIALWSHYRVTSGADHERFKEVLRKLNHGQHVDAHYMNLLVLSFVFGSITVVLLLTTVSSCRPLGACLIVHLVFLVRVLVRRFHLLGRAGE